MNFKSYNIGDEVSAISPPMVDARGLGFFDELENECYELFESYCKKLGIELSYPGPDDCIDFYIAKEIQGKILDVITECGIQINYNDDNQERRFTELTNQIEALKSNLSNNTFSLPNSEKYEMIRRIGGLLLERDNIFGTDLTENCFIASDNEFYNEIIGFLGDKTELTDAYGNPLRIGDTLTFEDGTDKEYERVVLNGLITQDMISGKRAVKTADFCDCELINTDSAAFTVSEIDCKAFYQQSLQNETQTEGTEMS